MNCVVIITRYGTPFFVRIKKRSRVIHRVSLVTNRTLLQNKVRSLLEKYHYKTELRDRHIRKIWNEPVMFATDPIDKVIMNTTLAYIQQNNSILISTNMRPD